MRRSREVSNAEVRRLNAELGIESSRGNLFGVVLGAALIAGLTLLAAPFVFDVGPSERVYGRVIRLGYSQTDYGSMPWARVQVGQDEVSVRLFRSRPCRVGDRIEVVRRRALVGRRYTPGPAGCMRPG